MKTISSRSREVAELIRDRVSFKTYGALRAETHTSTWVYYGHLTGEDAEQLRIDSQAGIDYVVWSYSTPIAWHKKDGSWYKVKARFSMTTSHHQGKLYLIGSDTEAVQS